MRKELDIFELRREIVHILSGIGFVLFLLFLPYAKIILFLILIFGGFVSFFSTQFYIPVFSKCLGWFERDGNRGFPGKGVIFFFIGSLLSLQLFEQNIAIASILILSFADPVSHFVGANFGSTKIFRKNIEGPIAGILAGTFFASFFVHPLLAFAGSFAAMFLEAVEIAMAGKTVDDNLIIPLVAGTIIYLLSGVI